MNLPSRSAEDGDGDAELWLAGYELRIAHLPIDGSPECPVCHVNWECAAYRAGVEMMRAATDGPPAWSDEPLPGASDR